MHILALFAAAIGGIAVWYWRLKTLRDVGNEVADVVGQVKGLYRTSRFRRQAEGSALNAIEDPALAAAVLLLALANEAPPAAAPRCRELALTHIAKITPEGERDEFLAYAEWVARNVVDPKDCVRRFRPLWRDRLTVPERMQLIGMAQDIADAALPAVPQHRLVLDAMRNTMLK